MQQTSHAELDPVPDETAARMPLHRTLDFLRNYAPAMILALSAVMVGYAIIAVLSYVATPSRALTTIPFRLEFQGASRGEYPNGSKFSSAEITATPVLRKVYEDNKSNLKEFVAFDQFSQAIYVLEQNAAYESLVLEYQAKLSDPRLTPVDRERLEREFDMKRGALNKSDYSVNFLRSSTTAEIPQSVVDKAMGDILSQWARQAAVEKHVLDYRVPVLTSAILDRSAYDRVDTVIALAMLRNKVNVVISNLEQIATLPGVELIRTKEKHKSLTELKYELDDIVRYRIEPAISMARSSSAMKDPAGSLRILEAQLSYDQRRLNSARSRQTALRDAFSVYDQSTATKPEDVRAPVAQPRGSQAGENFVFSENFVDRIVDMSNRAADHEYRQKMIDGIRQAALETVPLEAAVAYDQQILEEFRKPGPVAGADTTDRLRQQWNDTYAALGRAMQEINEIYLEASRQLNPVTELYTAGPVMSRVDRPIHASRLALYGILVLLISLPIVVAGALLHSRVRDEEAPSAVDPTLDPAAGPDA
jgi:hypothetical protein